MRTIAVSAIALSLAMQANAAETRQLEAHEHGVGALNIAVEGSEILMELEVPGADIVGFEHEAESAEDRAAVDAAIAILAKPLDLFVLPGAAECSVTEAKAALVDEDDHHEHEEHEEHEEHDDDHNEAQDEGHDHDHDDDHADHDGHGEEHHSEFHAEYALTCAAPQAIDRIDFAYFAQFPNARELVIQMISDKGTKGFEVESDSPTLSLNGAI